MKCSTLLKEVNLTVGIDFEVNDLQMHSKEVKENDIFFAIKGANVDGHTFIEEAINKGAKLVICERKVTGYPCLVVDNIYEILGQLAYVFYEKPSDSLMFIGVTGTNGKTTVTSLIYQCMQSHKEAVCVLGTNGLYYYNEYIPLKNTTPDPLLLMKCLKRVKDAGIKIVIMEVSSHALVLKRVQYIQFDIAVFTNLTQDHLDFHKTMEEYFNAKSLLFSSLKENACAIINTDDSYGKRLVTLTRASVYTYSVVDESKFKANDVNLSLDGSSFTVEGTTISNQLLSLANVYNTIAVYVCLKVLGYKEKKIVSSLNKVHSIKGRLVKVYADEYVVLVDYAHSPDGVSNVLMYLNKIKNNRIITVIGCGGNRDKTKRPIMANVTCEYSDVAIFTSDNPRNEDPKAILDDMINELNYKNYYVIINRKEAIRKAIRIAKKDDIIAVLGKGHEDYQIIGNKKIHFSDTEEILIAIKGT